MQIATRKQDILVDIVKRGVLLYYLKILTYTNLKSVQISICACAQGNETFEVPDTRAIGEAELSFEAEAGGLEPDDEGEYVCVAEGASFGSANISISIDVIGKH